LNSTTNYATTNTTTNTTANICLTDLCFALLYSILIYNNDKQKLVVAKALGGAGADAFAKLKEQGVQAESMKQQAFKRMEKGIHDILALHTPYELSSICGQMGLKQQQKPDVSMKQIIIRRFTFIISNKRSLIMCFI
jgi:hypothetical protein